MKIPFFDLKRQHASIKGELDEAIARVISSGQFILGEEVEAFEKEFAAYTGVENCVTCANGTDALEMALEVLELAAGDEVVLAGFGWVSGALAIKRVGATPIFVDIHPGTFHITEQEVAPAITPRTKAVIVVHLFGQYNPLAGIKALCEQHNLRLIEDCAQAHGLFVDGKHVGTTGDIGTFSFYPTKNLGCLGDGGGLIINEPELAHKLKAIRDYGRVAGKFMFDGRNSRLDELQAAVLRTKLPHLDAWNERRREVANRYYEALNSDHLVLPTSEHNVYHQYPIILSGNQVVKHILGSQLEMIDQSDLAEFWSQFAEKQCSPNARAIFATMLRLPMYPELREDEILRISSGVSEIQLLS